jgi:hypothetical protein
MMSSTNGDNAFLRELELNVRAELTMVESGDMADEVAAPSETCLFEAEDAERYQVGLRGLLGAVVGLEDDPRTNVDPASAWPGETPRR